LQSSAATPLLQRLANNPGRASSVLYGTANPSTLATMIPELPGTAVHLGGLNNSQVCENS